MPDFEQKIQHCYHNYFFVTKDMGKKNFHRSCLERINLSWFVTTLSSAKTKHLPGILNCRHFDGVCFYGNIMAPIPSRAEITQETLSMRSHFAAVSTAVILVPRGRAPFGQHQELRPLAVSNNGSPRFTDFPSLCACSESRLTNLIGSGLNLLCLQIPSKQECRWIWPEVAILGADQKERGLWG